MYFFHVSRFRANLHQIFKFRKLTFESFLPAFDLTSDSADAPLLSLLASSTEAEAETTESSSSEKEAADAPGIRALPLRRCRWVEVGEDPLGTGTSIAGEETAREDDPWVIIAAVVTLLCFGVLCCWE